MLIFCGRCLFNTEKRKNSSESSTWALCNFLREVNQSKENSSASKTCSGKLLYYYGCQKYIRELVVYGSVSCV